MEEEWEAAAGRFKYCLNTLNKHGRAARAHVGIEVNE